jgi:Tfp pilus assembly protein PilF
MSLQSVDDAREVVPRWRSFADAKTSVELAPLRRVQEKASEAELAPLRAQFESSRDRYVIADYLGALIAYQVDQKVIDPVAYALAAVSEEGSGLWAFATDAIKQGNQSSAQDVGELSSINRHARLQLRALRQVMKRSPRRATFRMDAALAHATLGNRESANREARIALELAPTNRFIVRSAARLLISQGDPDEAAWVLRGAGSHVNDPWVLAPLMSAMQLAGQKQTEFRAARELATVGHHSETDLAELWSEMATIELSAGRTKVARSLFKASLQDPNDNVVAQAEWASKAGGFSLPEHALDVERGYEARSRAFAREARWEESVIEGRAWQRDEPFALEPALSTSYVAALVLEDYERALEVASAGLNFHPDDSMLRNNAAFAAAHLGKTPEAQEHLRRAGTSDGADERTTIIATRGLIAFREGDPAKGRELYSQAVSEFRRAGNADMSTLAASLWALEELRAHSPVAGPTRDAALRDSAHAQLPEAELLIQRMKNAFSAPGSWSASAK